MGTLVDLHTVEVKTATGLWPATLSVIQGGVEYPMEGPMQYMLDTSTAPSTPVDPVIHTIYGSCPAAGGTSLAAAQSVVTKWGSGVAIRQFLGGLQQPNFPTGCKLMHVSFNTTIPVAGLIAGDYDDAIGAWAEAVVIPDGVILCAEWMHEMDSKYRKGQISLADGIAGKSRFYDAVKAVRSDIKIVATYTGWLFEALDPTPYSAVKADWLGIDLDGVDANSGGVYPPWNTSMGNIQTWTDRMGYFGWCVPEFGSPRHSTDPTGANRGAWMQVMADRCYERGSQYVAAFEYPTGGADFNLTTAAELAAWQTVCDAYNA